MSLLDDVKDLHENVWSSRDVLPQQTKRAKALAPQARQFLFDEEASRMLGHFIATCPDIMVDHMQFARQPYEVTYIELFIQEIYMGMGLPDTSAFDDEVDLKLGILSSGGILYNLSNSTRRLTPILGPLCTMDHEYRKEKISDFVNDSKVLLGTTWHRLNDAQRDAFSDRFSIGFLGPDWAKEKALELLLPAMIGEARIYVAALLFLYQRQHLTITDHPFHRTLKKGKLRTYMAHSNVKIHLSQFREVCRAFTVTERSSPRRHEVRTHYKHRHLTAGCEHQWVKVEDAENEQWRCSHCDGLRWLCKNFLRGDANIGFVNKTYEVTP